MDNLNKITLTALNIKRIFIVGLIYIMHTALYNYVSTHHVNDNFNLLTDLDKLFPFVPEMVYLYVSFYFVIIISVFFLRTEESFDRIIASIIGALLFTYPLFYFFPANYPVPSFEANTFTTRFLKWCFASDVPNNTFPSLHVSLSFTMAFGIKHYRKKLGMLYLIWASGIALSTLMIRKHFLIDSFSGIVMATFSYNLFVSGKLTKPLFDTFGKIKHYSAYLVENKLTAKRVSRNLVYLFVTILRMK
ncbi:MAG: phosphatase PAP2 family protein [Ignavibacteriaceae bacterium]|nr:phosphatase PAP2 family protein [Ignavibacteriaceae bacterium]